jgi:hypothetical protein
MQIVRWLAVALGALLAGAVTYSAIALIFHFLAWAGGPSSPAMEACLYFQAALFGAGVSRSIGAMLGVLIALHVRAQEA